MTRAQLLDCGVDRRTLERWAASGRLIRAYRGVYAVGHTPADPISRAHAALLAAGPGSALAGAWALVLWGVWNRWAGQPELVVPEDRRPKGIVVHVAKTLRRSDVTLVQGVRVTSPARTLLDTAVRLTPRQRDRAVNDLRLRGKLTLPELEDVLARNPTHPAVTLLRPQLENAQAQPTRSTLEDRFLALLRKHRLPTPEVNVHIAGHRVDAHFADHDLIVELDGYATHGRRQAFVADRRRDLHILLATGKPTVRLSAEDLTDASILRLGALLQTRMPRAAVR